MTEVTEGNAVVRASRLRHSLMLAVIAFTAAAGLVVGGGRAAAASNPITEFTLSSTAQPGYITDGPDGNVWFSEINNISVVGKITPAGIVTEYPLTGCNSSAFQVVSAPDGNVYFPAPCAGPNVAVDAASIGRLTPSGTYTMFPIPALPGNAGADEASPSGPAVIGPDGNLWFGGDQGYVARFNFSTDSVDEFPLPSQPSWGGTESMTVGPDGNLWLSEPFDPGVGIALIKLVVAAAVPGTSNGFSIVNLPSSQFGGMENQIAPTMPVGPDGNFWITNVGDDSVSSVTTGGTATTFPIPSGSPGFNTTSGPTGLSLGSDSNLWLVEQTSQNIARVTPQGAVTEFPVANTGLRASVAGPPSDPNSVWFTADGVIGRVDLAVADSHVIATVSAGSLTATEGIGSNATLATFTDSDSDPVGDFTASVSWGDGTTSAASVQATGSSGVFAVVGSHAYAEESAVGTSNIVHVTITDSSGDGTTGGARDSITVADAQLTASGITAQLKGKGFKGVVATFSDGDTAGAATDYGATINWGDGTSTAGTIAAANGGFTVKAGHKYAAKGTFTVTVQIADAGGANATATSTL